MAERAGLFLASLNSPINHYFSKSYLQSGEKRGCTSWLHLSCYFDNLSISFFGCFPQALCRRVWIETQLESEDGILLSYEKQKVVMEIDRKVAGYFKRRQLIANQIIEKELEDGGLIISAKPAYRSLLDTQYPDYQPR